MAENNDMRGKLEKIVSAYEELQEKMSDPSVIADQHEYNHLAKEYADQGPLVKQARAYLSDLDDLEAARELLDDPDGRELAQEEIARIESAAVDRVDFSGDAKLVYTADCVYDAKSVVIASGAHPRHLGIPGEGKLVGHGVSYCATCDGGFFRGRDVAVVGGGDTAVSDAVYLARLCRRVYVVHRRDSLRAAKSYQDALFALDNVECVWNATAASFETDDAGALSGLVVEDVATGEKRTLPVAGVFVAVGTVPNTDYLAGQVKLNEQGAVVTDERTLATSARGVFAAGDVRTTPLRQVVTSASDGARAAESAAQFMEVW